MCTYNAVRQVPKAILMMNDCLNPRGVWIMGADVEQASADWEKVENASDIFKVWNILSLFQGIGTVDQRDGRGLEATSRAMRVLSDVKIRYLRTSLVPFGSIWT